MNDKEFIKEVYELAYGDSAFDKGFITGHEEVLAKMQYYTELSYKAELFSDEVNEL